MFFRAYGYSLKRSIRQKYQIFWCLLFPIILGTLFKVSFGDVNETEMTFHQIPVAYIEKEGAQQEFETLLEQLEKENELVEVVLVKDMDKAKQLLEDGEVEGIYENGEKIVLTVKEEEIAQSILKSIQEQYEQALRTMTNVGMKNPQGIQAAHESLEKQWDYLEDSNISNRKMDNMTNYFYALIAMNCLYGCFLGVGCAKEFKANLSDLAARRVAASTNRFIILLGEVTAQITAQFVCCTLGACYLKYALKIDFGDQMARMLLVILLGSSIGVMLGLFVGSIGRLEDGVKDGLCVGVSMLCSFLAGLMIGNMYRVVEQNVPIINRLNPAALIVNAFYSLNIYEDYTRYNQCIINLLIITVVLGVASYLVVRRERYASI